MFLMHFEAKSCEHELSVMLLLGHFQSAHSSFCIMTSITWMLAASSLIAEEAKNLNEFIEISNKEVFRTVCLLDVYVVVSE